MELAKTIAFSAVGGMVVGIAGCGGKAAPAADQPTADTTAAAADTTAAAAEAGAKACCKGQHDCGGKGSCQVKVGDKLADGSVVKEGEEHGCKTKNKCKAKGGCNAHCPK